MYLTVSHLTNFSLHANDEPLGSVRDLFIDDTDWTVRYLVIQPEASLSLESLLITPDRIRHVDTEARIIYIDATRADVEAERQRNGSAQKHLCLTGDDDESTGDQDALEEALRETFPASDPPATW